MEPVFFVFIGILTTSAAQILLKIGSSNNLFSLKWFAFLLFSITFYFISFICYYISLKYYDISKLSSVTMTATITIVSIYGWCIGEEINVGRMSGIILSVVSIFLISRS